MKVISPNQLAQARFTQPLPKGLWADGWRSISGKLCAPLFYCVTTALCVLAVSFLSVLVIGEADRFGIAPQYSFLSLNLTLIAFCLLFLLAPLRARIKHSHAAQAARAASAAATQINAEPMGKLLIIRRHKEFRRQVLDECRLNINYRRER
ncbi:MAG: hypothetical protein DMF64_00220 [Acidobacteria bacterium]|nr:MAG: hypothetical protein DMF64_00220 [Acidobacteriota bacterium]